MKVRCVGSEIILMKMKNCILPLKGPLFSQHGEIRTVGKKTGFEDKHKTKRNLGMSAVRSMWVVKMFTPSAH